jgi:hypothetical protein
MSALHMQHGGRHYKDLAIQPVEYALANVLPFCEGCVVKYVTRWRSKGGIDDLRKARHFLQFLIEAPMYKGHMKRIAALVFAGAWWRDTITPKRYSEANNLSAEEAGVVRCVTVWAHTGAWHELEAAVKWMEDLLAKALEEKEYA